MAGDPIHLELHLSVSFNIFDAGYNLSEDVLSRLSSRFVERFEGCLAVCMDGAAGEIAVVRIIICCGSQFNGY
jgi:hypothetical protein